MPAPPALMGNVERDQLASGTVLPRTIAHADRSNGDVHSAVCLGAAVRKIQMTLHADKHCRRISDAALGSPKHSSLCSARSNGWMTLFVTHAAHAIGCPIGLPSTDRHPSGGVRGMPGRYSWGRSIAVTGVSIADFPLFRARPMAFARSSNCGSMACMAALGPAMYPSSRYQWDHP